MGALRRFLSQYFKMPTQANIADRTTVIGITLAAPNNPDRLMLVMMNLSDTDMYVSPDKITSATHGFRLAASGGSLQLNATVDGELVGYEWNVYCTAAAKALFTLEVEGGR